ncbi:MAG: SDR family oxidoreductase [Pseudomonadota bacterium]
MQDRLTDKAIIVTGAAGGIGAATVRRLAAEGARVCATDLDREAVESALAGVDGEVLCRGVDVTDESAVQQMVADAAAQFGRLDGLFNNAGIEGEVAYIEDYSMDVFEQVMAVNVRGVFHCIKHVVGPLRDAGGGSIVNTASTAGLRGSPMLPAYNASKHAVIGMTRSTADAYGRHGIRSNAVCPAPIETRMMRSIETGMGGNEPQVVKDRFTNSIPLGRYGEPEEVAALVAFLLSDESRFINGSMYSIDGGLTPM